MLNLIGLGFGITAGGLADRPPDAAGVEGALLGDAARVHAALAVVDAALPARRAALPSRPRATRCGRRGGVDDRVAPCDRGRSASLKRCGGDWSRPARCCWSHARAAAGRKPWCRTRQRRRACEPSDPLPIAGSTRTRSRGRPRSRSVISRLDLDVDFDATAARRHRGARSRSSLGRERGRARHLGPRHRGGARRQRRARALRAGPGHRACSGDRCTSRSDRRPSTVVVRYRTSPEATRAAVARAAQTAGGKQPFLFTQSQAIHARTWIPLPGHARRCASPTTPRVRVPPDLLARDERREPAARSDADGVYRFHMPQPIPSYLIALAVGDLAFRALGAAQRRLRRAGGGRAAPPGSSPTPRR